ACHGRSTRLRAQAGRQRGGAALFRPPVDRCAGGVQTRGRSRSAKGRSQTRRRSFMTVASQTVAPVKKAIVVKADVAHAFRVYTEGFDSWWPRSHHIGKSPMTRAVLEAKNGGRCYSEQEDGTECDWGTVLMCEPPRRLLIA